MAELRDILVVSEIREGGLSPLTKEILGAARQMAGAADRGVNLILAGNGASSRAAEGIAFGADRVFKAENPSSLGFPYDFYTYLTVEMCRETGASLCMMGHTDLGREVAPRVAARLGAGLCMDCVEVKFDSQEGTFVQTRPVFGGKAMAEIASLPGIVQVDTIRQKSMSRFVLRSERKGEIIDLQDRFDDGPFKTKLIDRNTEEESGVSLENAKIVVAGGGGIGGKEGFELIKELCRLLKAAPGASRVPVDEGWMPHSTEIGQTGAIISPEVYVAIGISGATQHITGILGSKRIVAINKDPEANIFKVSDLGVVADYREFLPEVIEKLKWEA
jgi:electron transfer flavoprotein alpha subunit